MNWNWTNILLAAILFMNVAQNLNMKRIWEVTAAHWQCEGTQTRTMCVKKF